MLYRQAFFNAYGWATRRLYHELAWAYDPISAWASAGRWESWRRLALAYAAGPRVLEVGFGTGALLAALAERGHSVVGVDASREMRRVAAARLRRAGWAVPILLGRAAALPFADGSFDSILSTFPAGFVLEPASLRELGRVLRPAGCLVIVGLAVELPPSLRFPLSIVPGAWPPLWAYFQRVAELAGLTVELEWHADPPARVPVILARRQPEATS